MDTSYSTIYKICDEFFTNKLMIGELLVVLKILAIAFFLINVYSNMFSRVQLSMGNAQLPFNEKKLFSSLAIVLVIIFYDKFLNFLDSLLLGFDSFYGHLSPVSFLPEDEEIQAEPNLGTMAKLYEFAAESLQIFADPSHVVLLLVKGTAWIIDTVIYLVFLVERFFFIGLLKILGAIAIVMAVFEKFRDYFYKWLKLYIAVYLLIFPFFLIMGLSMHVYEFIDQSIAEKFPNKAIRFLVGDEIKVIGVCIMIWLKLRLYKKSNELVYKLFT